MFAFLGRMAYRWRWAILVVWGAALLLSLPVLPRVAGALKASDPAFQAAIDRSLAEVRTLPSVTGIILPATDPNLISDDGDTAYAIVGLAEGPEEAQRLVSEFEAALLPQDG